MENHDSTKGQSTTDDLKLVRSAIEKTYRPIRPDTHVLMMWGLICLIGYTAAYFSITPQGQISPLVRKWILPAYLALMAIGLCYTIVSLSLIAKRQKKAGFIPNVNKQITWVWVVITLHILTWSALGMVFNNFCGGDPGFLAAMGISIALCITGILHSKEWIVGGILIFIGMMLTYVVKDYGYLILGLATGTGLIVPALIVHKKYKGENHE